MQTQPEELAASGEQRFAMVRVFGGTALAFIALLIVALLVRPDLMKDAAEMVMSVMR